MDLDTYIRKNGYGAIAKIARDAVLSYTTVHRILTKGVKPQADTAVRISKATGGVISIAELCDPPPKPKRTAKAKRTRRAA